MCSITFKLLCNFMIRVPLRRDSRFEGKLKFCWLKPQNNNHLKLNNSYLFTSSHTGWNMKFPFKISPDFIFHPVSHREHGTLICKNLIGAYTQVKLFILLKTTSMLGSFPIVTADYVQKNHLQSWECFYINKSLWLTKAIGLPKSPLS